MSDLIKREDAIDAIGADIDEIDALDPSAGIKKACIRRAIWKVMGVPSADRPQGKWIIHYRDKWMVRAECPKCHRRFEFSPRAIWKCCPMCETRMKGADDYERAIEQTEHDMLYEPTYSSEDGSM